MGYEPDKDIASWALLIQTTEPVQDKKQVETFSWSDSLPSTWMVTARIQTAYLAPGWLQPGLVTARIQKSFGNPLMDSFALWNLKAVATASIPPETVRT